MEREMNAREIEQYEQNIAALELRAGELVDSASDLRNPYRHQHAAELITVRECIEQAKAECDWWARHNVPRPGEGFRV